MLLSCYAPLFVNVSQWTGNGRSMQWSSDLIGYDALTSYGSPSYYAQMMFTRAERVWPAMICIMASLQRTRISAS